ncbi:putative ribonuclease H-like domain-containing protein [Tanacetum coccineum]
MKALRFVICNEDDSCPQAANYICCQGFTFVAAANDDLCKHSCQEREQEDRISSFCLLLVVTYGTAVSFAAAYDEYVLLSATCQENCEFDWLLGACARGMHVVPPPMIGNYMSFGPDIEVDYSQFTYGPKQTQPSESETQTSEFDTCESNISTKPLELVSEPVVNESNVECQPKVWSDAPIIEEYESDSEDEYVSLPTKEQKTPSFATHQVKSPRETVKNHFTHSKNRKVEKKELGYGFTTRACFVCGSLNHLIRDCDFHEKRMAKQAVLNNRLKRNSINTARTSGTKNVSTARHSFNRQAVLTSTAMKVNTVKPIMNRVRPANVFHNTHSSFSMPFINRTALRTNFSKQKVNTTKVNAVGAIGGKRETDVKPSAGCNWRHHNWHNDYPHRALQNKGIVDSGCSRHMTRNKAYLAEYQDFNGGPVAFGGSKGYITGKGKQHKASCKAKSVSYISHSLQLLHMDLFGPTSVRILNHKTYCLVTTDDFSRFSWVFFLRTKDETGGLLKDFIRQIENQLNQKVKTIRFDNGTEFKNRDFIEFYGSKGIKREYSNARTPQQNGVAERKNRTLIEAARTMLVDSFLPNTFWTEAVSTACYVLNRVLVTKPHNKTPYELVTDEGFLVGYSLQSKAFTVYNLETKRVEENLHITFLENKPNVAGKEPTWLFDLDYLTDSMNYQLVRSKNQGNKHAGLLEANHNAGTQDNIDAGNSDKDDEFAQDYFVLPIWSSYSSTIKRSIAKDAGEVPDKHPDLKIDEKPVDKEDQVFLDELERLKKQENEANDAAEALRKEFAQETKNLLIQTGAAKASSTNIVNTVSTPVSTASPYGGLSFSDPTNPEQDDSEIPALEDIYQNPTDGIFTNSSYDDEGSVADFTNLEIFVNVSPIPTSRIHSIHPSTLILGDPQSAVQTRSKVTKSSRAYAFFKIQKVWILVDLPYRKKAIRTKWVYRNKKDERGVVVRNKARLVAQGHRQEEGIDYDEVFAPVARIEAIRIFLAFASYMGLIVYQMDVTSVFLYGKINEEVYVSQPPGFLDPKYPHKVYKVVKALYGLQQAPIAWYANLSTFLLKNGYRRGTIDKTLFS